MARIYTRSVKGEENPWQNLAGAIVVQAVKDYRARKRMMRRLEKQLQHSTDLSNEERAFLYDRYQHYAVLQDELCDFFFSELFCKTYDLDGYDLLDSLEREVQK